MFWLPSLSGFPEDETLNKVEKETLIPALCMQHVRKNKCAEPWTGAVYYILIYPVDSKRRVGCVFKKVAMGVGGSLSATIWRSNEVQQGTVGLYPVFLLTFLLVYWIPNSKKRWRNTTWNYGQPTDLLVSSRNSSLLWLQIDHYYITTAFITLTAGRGVEISRHFIQPL